MNNKTSICCFLFLHMLAISGYYVFPIKSVILLSQLLLLSAGGC